jgi:hypothetical protein
MTLQGKWRIVELPEYDADYADMMGPAYIAFDDTGGEFAFGCVTGSFPGAIDSDAVTFDWDGNDEMDEACGDGWAERQADGSLIGEIRFHSGDEIAFTARPWPTSSTAC